MIRWRSFWRISNWPELPELKFDAPKLVDNPSALVTPVGGVESAAAAGVLLLPTVSPETC